MSISPFSFLHFFSFWLSAFVYVPAECLGFLLFCFYGDLTEKLRISLVISFEYQVKLLSPLSN